MYKEAYVFCLPSIWRIRAGMLIVMKNNVTTQKEDHNKILGDSAVGGIMMSGMSLCLMDVWRSGVLNPQHDVSRF